MGTRQKKIADPQPVELDLPTKNKSGQLMYRKGEETRRRLVHATEELLKAKLFTELTVTEIARCAGSSKPNFYLYFDGVMDVVLAAVQNVSMSTPEVLATVNRPWPAASIDHCAQAFVHEYFKHWRANAHVLKVRTAMVANGESRFMEAEIRATEVVLQALTDKLEQARGPGKDTVQSPHPASLAGAMLALLERLAAVTIEPGLPSGITDARVMQAAASLVAAGMGARIVSKAPSKPAGKATRSSKGSV